MIVRRGSGRRLAFVWVLSSMGGCTDEGPERVDPMEQDSEAMDGDDPVCIGLCKPLEQDCGPGSSCLPDQPGFSCQGRPGADGLHRGLHDACEAGSQTCDPGLVCLPVMVPGCTGSSGCCVAMCNVDDPECTEGTTCHPIFDASLMCFEDVGVCVLS